MTNLQEFYDEWKNKLKHNPEFLKAFKKDPERALLNEGLHVCPEDLVKIKAMLKLDASKNEKLDDRINR